LKNNCEPKINAKGAIAVAREATPADAIDDAPLPGGLKAGDAVVVFPEEDGSGVVAGELAASGVHEFAIRRQSEQADELMVHFPREDDMVMKAG